MVKPGDQIKYVPNHPYVPLEGSIICTSRLVAIFEWNKVADGNPAGYGYFLVYGKNIPRPAMAYFLDYCLPRRWLLAIYGEKRDVWEKDITEDVEWWAEIPIPPHEGANRLQFSLWNR